MIPENKTTTLSPKHQLFVTEMIAHGNQTRAYQTAYPRSSEESARTHGCRLLKDPAIAQSITDGLQKVKGATIAQAKAEKKLELNQMMQKRDVLMQIIKGEANTQKEISTKRGTTIRTIVDVNAILRAIKQDGKLQKKIDKRFDKYYNMGCYDDI